MLQIIILLVYVVQVCVCAKEKSVFTAQNFHFSTCALEPPSLFGGAVYTHERLLIRARARVYRSERIFRVITFHSQLIRIKGAETYLLVCAAYEFSKLLIIINYKSMGAEWARKEKFKIPYARMRRTACRKKRRRKSGIILARSGAGDNIF